MSNQAEPSQIELRKRHTNNLYANLLELAHKPGAATDRQAMSARALSAAEWTNELDWADSMATQQGWNEIQMEALIERLKVRHIDRWGIYAITD